MILRAMYFVLLVISIGFSIWAMSIKGGLTGEFEPLLRLFYRPLGVVPLVTSLALLCLLPMVLLWRRTLLRWGGLALGASVFAALTLPMPGLSERAAIAYIDELELSSYLGPQGLVEQQLSAGSRAGYACGPVCQRLLMNGGAEEVRVVMVPGTRSGRSGGVVPVEPGVVFRRGSGAECGALIGAGDPCVLLGRNDQRPADVRITEQTPSAELGAWRAFLIGVEERPLFRLQTVGGTVLARARPAGVNPIKRPRPVAAFWAATESWGGDRTGPDFPRRTIKMTREPVEMFLRRTGLLPGGAHIRPAKNGDPVQLLTPAGRELALSGALPRHIRSRFEGWKPREKRKEERFVGKIDDDLAELTALFSGAERRDWPDRTRYEKSIRFVLERHPDHHARIARTVLTHLNGNDRLRMSPITELVGEFSEGKPGRDPAVHKGLSAEFLPLVERSEALRWPDEYPGSGHLFRAYAVLFGLEPAVIPLPRRASSAAAMMKYMCLQDAVVADEAEELVTRLFDGLEDDVMGSYRSDMRRAQYRAYILGKRLGREETLERIASERLGAVAMTRSHLDALVERLTLPDDPCALKMPVRNHALDQEPVN